MRVKSFGIVKELPNFEVLSNEKYEGWFLNKKTQVIYTNKGKCVFSLFSRVIKAFGENHLFNYYSTIGNKIRDKETIDSFNEVEYIYFSTKQTAKEWFVKIAPFLASPNRIYVFKGVKKGVYKYSNNVGFYMHMSNRKVRKEFTNKTLRNT